MRGHRSVGARSPHHLARWCAILAVSHALSACSEDAIPPFEPGPGGQPAAYSAVSAGGSHTCGISDRGNFCWGDGGAGQLGTGLPDDRSIPTAIAGGRTLTGLSAGKLHTCAVATGGETLCWGEGDDGRLGNGLIQDWLTPALVSETLRFTAVSAGDTHTCGIATTGETYCWGDGSGGRLGIGNELSRVNPAQVLGGLRFAQVSAGSAHT